MRMINPTIATTITMTTTFGSLKLCSDHECSCNIALCGRKCQHRPYIVAGTPKHPADAESKRDKQKPRENAARAKDLENLVEVHNRDQHNQENETDIGKQVEWRLHARGRCIVTRLHKEPDGERQEHQQYERLFG